MCPLGYVASDFICTLHVVYMKSTWNTCTRHELNCTNLIWISQRFRITLVYTIPIYPYFYLRYLFYDTSIILFYPNITKFDMKFNCKTCNLHIIFIRSVCQVIKKHICHFVWISLEGSISCRIWNWCKTLQWRHNGRDGISNHQPHEC